MTKTSKIVLWVIIVVIVVVAAVWFFMSPKGSAPNGQGVPAPTSQNVPVAPVVQNTPTAPTPAPQGALQTAPTDDSNSALNQDLATINDQLNGLASDTASIDQGLNDQPVTQGQ
jgi:flagellar basal body-associated protein FliL